MYAPLQNRAPRPARARTWITNAEHIHRSPFIWFRPAFDGGAGRRLWDAVPLAAAARDTSRIANSERGLDLDGAGAADTSPRVAGDQRHLRVNVFCFFPSLFFY
ncbi:hypothetical protein EVAR_97656_1 [Eumeta japonica]|uniref:Uncharacterized protein n=1 Tax=Eumeta variegata TaxID=151549 RepID=A0A4C1WYF6_EUMVA|nr:hypothetical protein EVAR_97656_1 [Eumeta japonica]